MLGSADSEQISGEEGLRNPPGGGWGVRDARYSSSSSSQIGGPEQHPDTPPVDEEVPGLEAQPPQNIPR